MIQMDMAMNGTLSRTHTAPPMVHTTNAHQNYSSLNSYSHGSYRTSDSTQGTATSTLFSPSSASSTPVNGGGADGSSNVLNKRADKETSLFQICLNLRQRLRAVPEFNHWLLEEEQDADDDTDPVTLLWRIFRRGYPLMTIYNALKPATPLQVDEAKVNEKKRGQAATFKFLQAAVNELKFPPEECFILTDLYADDTTGFVRVAKVVDRVLDTLVDAGVLSTNTEGSGPHAELTTVKRTQREHIIDELVKTERTYVQHLELLQAFRTLVETKGIVSGDAVHDIFLNLNALLDFQRRFLIRVEQTNSQPESKQNWGELFVHYKEAFKVYEPYIANQKKCEEVAMREFNKLKNTGGPPELQQMVESSTHLASFLLKPFQRLSKYPLLLKELHDKGDLDDERKSYISAGISAASSVLHRTNAAIDREECLEAVEELRSRVVDWKDYRIDGFGDLLLHGTFPVLKGDNKDNEHDPYKIYLFEMILLCCKEISPSKQKKHMIKPHADRKGKPILELKGRIFMQNVTEAIEMGKPGSYTCQIFWKGDPGIENFIIRFNNEETMKRWATQVDNQRRIWRERACKANSAGARDTGTSQTQFQYLIDLNLENPHKTEAEDSEDDSMTHSNAAGYNSHFPRHGSSSSLRSRSATRESQAALIHNDSRMPSTRVPAVYPPLKLRTPQLQQNWPTGERIDSYFSHAESPNSSHTSASSGKYPFSRQQTPLEWNREEQKRYVSPAMRHTTSRDGQLASGRNMQRPSLPPSMGSQSMVAYRSRSASSPDVQNPIIANRQVINGMNHPPVPDIPAPPFHVHNLYTPGLVSRSQNNSPNNPGVRAPTQSPKLTREKLKHSRGHGEQSQYEYQNILREGYHLPGAHDHPRALSPGFPVERHVVSPHLPMSTLNSIDVAFPSQIRVKVHYPTDHLSMKLVVPTNISFELLKDRIDAKLQRSAKVSLSTGQIKLKYLDDGDYVSILSDEDVQVAFETWKDQQREQILAGQLGEIELYCQ